MTILEIWQFIVEHGFQRCNFDCYVYFKTLEDDNKIYLLLYVDDILIACKDMDKIIDSKQLLMSAFEMKDLGATKKLYFMFHIVEIH